MAEHGIYSDRLAGSFIEEKEFSIAWHYRQSDPEQANFIVKDAILKWLK
ncbi:MAG: trehalose-phosphatase [candidate division WOR-3 bacterium]